MPFDNGHFFITFTCYKWLQLFAKTDCYDSVYKWFDILKNQGHFIAGFVIMPNHIHLLWEQLKMNGKEFPKNSFEKFTAKSLVNKMKTGKDAALQNYAVAATDRQYNIWLRDPLAINIFTREMAAQKLDYMHLNPLQPHWLLCADPADYRFSSAFFYERNLNEFELLTHFEKVF